MGGHGRGKHSGACVLDYRLNPDVLGLQLPSLTKSKHWRQTKACAILKRVINMSAFNPFMALRVGCLIKMRTL